MLRRTSDTPASSGLPQGSSPVAGRSSGGWPTAPPSPLLLEPLRPMAAALGCCLSLLLSRGAAASLPARSVRMPADDARNSLAMATRLRHSGSRLSSEARICDRLSRIGSSV
jgi:hypothetical protein